MGTCSSMPHRRSSPVSTSPTSRLPTPSRSLPRSTGSSSATAPRRASVPSRTRTPLSLQHPAPPSVGNSPGPSPFPPTSSPSAPAPTPASATSTTAYLWRFTGAPPSPTNSTPRHRRCSRSPRRPSTTTTSSSGSVIPSASTTRSSCPSSTPARWRTPAASPSATNTSSAAPPPTRSSCSGATPSRTRWRTCGSGTLSRCAGGMTSGSTSPSPNTWPTEPSPAQRNSPTRGSSSRSSARCGGMPRSEPRRPTRSPGPRLPMRVRPSRTSMASPTPRARPSCANSSPTSVTTPSWPVSRHTCAITSSAMVSSPSSSPRCRRPVAVT